MKSWISILILFAGLSVFAQERVTTFGIQAKPIIPSNLFRAGETSIVQNGNDYRIGQQVGYSFGGVIRFGLTKWLSLESGISFVRRNYQASVFNEQSQWGDTTRFRVIGYEIPVSGLVFVKLSDQIYMNTSFGLALDMFPSDVFSGTTTDFYQYSQRSGLGKDSSQVFSWVKPGLIVNVGFEWRTEKSGYFYFGASYHRPFQAIYDSYLYYDRPNLKDVGNLQLSGNYLTLDLRYFFHEEPKEKKIERDPSTMPSWMKNSQ